MDEFLEEFLLEGRDLVDQATADLLVLEKQPGDAARLDSVFRAFHTLKGSAGIVDFAAMARALHAAEDVLSAVRAGTEPMTTALIGDSLTAIDTVSQWLDAIEASGELPAEVDAAADAIVQRFARRPSNPDDASAAAVASSAEALPDISRALLDAQCRMLRYAEGAGLKGRLGSAGQVAARILRHAGWTSAAVSIEQAQDEALTADDPAPLVAAIEAILSEATLSEAILAGAPGEAVSAAAPGHEVAAQVLRVDVERIDHLVRLTGELLVLANTTGHLKGLLAAGSGPNEIGLGLRDLHGRLDRLSRDLQHAVLALRVLPFGQMFQRFHRLVRDLGIDLGKSIRLVTEGDDTEADKTIVEGLFEPLLHVLRNAADHGLETEAERRRAGKPGEGTIRLTAAREGDRVVIEIADDGKGMDPDRIRDVALRRGIASPEALALMDEADILQLVFVPGFSTTQVITATSGRGVGMDAVRSAIQRSGGQVGIESRLSHGTTVRFVLPFAMVLTRVMTVDAGGQAFGIPLNMIVETARIDPSQVAPVGAAFAFTLRNRVVPLIDLAEAVGFGVNRYDKVNMIAVIAAVGGSRVGLLVDRLGEPVDVMLKPLEGVLSGTPGLAGTTLLGDGRVLIVLDVAELLQ